MTELTIQAWFDVRCPWCYIGHARLGRGIELFHESHPKVQVRVTNFSYQVAPNIPDRFEGNEADFLHRYEGYGEDRARDIVAELSKYAAEEDLDMRFDELQQVNTKPAHRLFQFAKKNAPKEVSDQLVDQLFESYFVQCLDLSDPEQLAKIGEEVGLNIDDARDAVTDTEYDDAIKRDHVRAQMLGAAGVPFYFFNAKYAVGGAREPNVIAGALEELLRRETADEPQENSQD